MVMTRYDKAKMNFLISTMNDDPNARYKFLKQMGNSFRYEDFDEYLDFQGRFETEDDLTQEEAKKMLLEMKKKH